MHAAAARRLPSPLLLLVRRRRPALVSSTFSTSSESGGSEDAYLETWQRQQIRPPAFYEEEGKHRRWFYHVDLNGRLYLEERRIKNITSCLKSAKFLDFFFKQVKRNDTGLHPEYPFLSPCGREMNFIKPADMPIVFHDLLTNAVDKPPADSDSGWELLYGGTLRQTFDPGAVFISPRTGRLYHTLAWAGVKGKKEEARPRFGLLRSQLGLVLMDYIHYEGEAPFIEWPTEKDGEMRQFPIRPLLEEEEPVWGLPPMPHEA